MPDIEEGPYTEHQSFYVRLRQQELYRRKVWRWIRWSLLAILIFAFGTEYYSDILERCAVRDAARAIQPPTECLELKNHFSSPTTGITSMLRFNIKAGAVKRCTEFYREHFEAINQSMWPNPILVFFRMLSMLMCTPIEVLLQTMVRILELLFNQSDVFDKVGLLLFFLILPTAFFCIYLHHRRVGSDPVNMGTRMPKLVRLSLGTGRYPPGMLAAAAVDPDAMFMVPRIP